MKIAAVASFLAAALSTVAASPASAVAHVQSNVHHHQRFLQDLDQLKVELAQWKQSKARQAALGMGLYAGQDGDFESDDASEDLARLYMAKVSKEEAERRNPHATFTLASPFTMLLPEEFEEFVSRGFPTAMTAGVGANSTSVHVVDQTPVEDKGIDWSATSRCVAPVQQQGSCGSCWAFAAVASLESAYCLKNGHYIKFSEQELASCMIDNGEKGGCGGSFPHLGLEYVKEKGSVCTGTSYEYTNANWLSAKRCQASQCTAVDHLDFDVVRVSDAIQDKKDRGKNPSFLREALKQQPVAIGVTAGNADFKQYEQGVLSQCGQGRLDHAVFAVGYAVTPQHGTVFKIRNSWGREWGDNGYVRIQGSACRVTEYGYFPKMK